MRNPLSDKVIKMKPSGIRKFFDIVSEMPDAISLGVGEPDFDTPWNIREEGIYSLEKGRTFYTSNAGLLELREAICEYNERRFQLMYDPKKEVMLTVGGSEGIDVALRAMLNPGDEVIMTKEELEAAITDKTKILVMAFPNNPTGAIMTREDLEAIAEVIIKHDLYVISDEIYAELTYSGNHVSIASLPGMRERTIVIGGFSKAFAMTGWRLGYAMGPAMIM